MLGLGGRSYWGRNEGAKSRGIVVVFAWMCSEDRHLKNYVQLYGSLGWDSLVCHSGCLNMFAPSQAMSMAFDVLNALVKELKTRPCPVVFASFSGGPKACMYKLLQIIEGNCEARRFLDDYRLVKECTSGYIYDSCPVDFYSELAFSFFLHPSVLGVPQPPKLLLWTANSIRGTLDAFSLSLAESQRADYWQTLYASVSMGAPYLILCSETDDLASYETICNFSQRLQELGADVKLVKWDSSPHVGHYRIHPVDYRASVSELLEKAAVLHSQRFKKVEGDGISVNHTHKGISRPACNVRKAAGISGESSRGLAMDAGPMQEEDLDGCIPVRGMANIRVSGVQSCILFDEIAPKNVEEWDITDLTRKPRKCVSRSRL